MASSEEYHVHGAWTRYSSWTARAVILFKHFHIPHISEYVNLYPSTSPVSILLPTPNGFVPALTVKSLNITISDSLAIAEYLAESHPDLGLWPKDKGLRALARSAVAEIHSGFLALRNTYACNYVARYNPKELPPVSDDVRKQVKRVVAIWAEARRKSKEILGEEDKGYLFGAFGIADAWYYPVISRFRTYGLMELAGVEVPKEVDAWLRKMWNETEGVRVLNEEHFEQFKDPGTAMYKFDNDLARVLGGAKRGTFPKEWRYE